MSKENGGYYDIDCDLDSLLASNGMVDEIMWLRDLQQRKLFLNSDICQETVADMVHAILQYNKEDAGIPSEERKPILLYICSNGGEVDAGFSLIDVIEASKTPVYTINLGYWYSMAFIIGITGHKRFATKNSKILCHDGISMVYASGSKAKDQMDYYNRLGDRTKDHILRYTNISEEQYLDKVKDEWYVFADEAKKLGIIDQIIGEDCDLEAII